MSQCTINDSTSCLNISNTPDAWISDTATCDRLQLIPWLSPLDPSLRHWDIQERRVSHVAEWLIQTEQLRRWYGLGRESEVERAVLFCDGDPGVARTFVR